MRLPKFPPAVLLLTEFPFNDLSFTLNRIILLITYGNVFHTFNNDPIDRHTSVYTSTVYVEKAPLFIDVYIENAPGER